MRNKWLLGVGVLGLLMVFGGCKKKNNDSSTSSGGNSTSPGTKYDGTWESSPFPDSNRVVFSVSNGAIVGASWSINVLGLGTVTPSVKDNFGISGSSFLKYYPTYGIQGTFSDPRHASGQAKYIYLGAESVLNWTATQTSSEPLQRLSIGVGNGSVTSNPAGLVCVPGFLSGSQECEGFFPNNSQVTLHISSIAYSTGWWEGRGCPTGLGDCSLTMDNHLSLQVN